MISRTTQYRSLLDRLEKEFYGGKGFEEFSCGNTMGMSVRDPRKCMAIFERFEQLKKTQGLGKPSSHERL